LDDQVIDWTRRPLSVADDTMSPMRDTAGLRLETVTPGNVTAACRLSVRPDQQEFVAPVAWSLAEAYASPGVAWPRLICRGDDIVGFIMGSFDPQNEIPFFRCGIWRLNVDARAQRSGVGRYAVGALLEEARRRGATRATVLWVPAPGGPGPFYEGLGFVPTGEQFHREIVGALALEAS
jgi:diamine N-acetyltransferase